MTDAPALGVSEGQPYSVGPASFSQRLLMDMDAWPLQNYLELGALPGAVPSARLHVRLILYEWGIQESGGTIELIVSELITNAVQVSQGLERTQYHGRWRPGTPPVRLWIESDREQVLVRVWDGNDEL